MKTVFIRAIEPPVDEKQQTLLDSAMVETAAYCLEATS